MHEQKKKKKSKLTSVFGDAAPKVGAGAAFPNVVVALKPPSVGNAAAFGEENAFEPKAGGLGVFVAAAAPVPNRLGAVVVAGVDAVNENGVAENDG